ncbi:MAG: FecR domain-containing protein [Actinomycetota bacterium]
MPVVTCACCRRSMMAGLAMTGLAGAMGIRRAVAMGLPESRVHRSGGEVSVNGTPATTGTRVRSGDTVATGAGGTAMFSLGDDGFLLRPDSRVTIADRDGARNVKLEGGGVLSVFGPKHITLTTPHASIGIRGTAAYLETRGDTTNVCVCYGHAVMVPTGAPQLAEDVHNRHHETPRVIRPGPAAPVMEEMRRTDHTDDELVMLEALFDRVPVFLRQSP